MSDQLKSRLKSFAWRFGAYIIVAAAAWISTNAGMLELPEWGIALIAYICGEITKYINKKALV